MSTSRKSSTVSTSTNTTTTNMEGTMSKPNTGMNCYQVITVKGRKIAIPEISAYKVLAITKVAVDQYARKAAETTIGKGQNVRDKNEEAIKYDKKMYNRMLIMQAFIKKVLEGIELPDSADEALIDQLNNL